MAFKTLAQSYDSFGNITCGDIGVSSSEWEKLLATPEADSYLDYLLSILRLPSDCRSCKEAALVYGRDPKYYNNKNVGFAKWVQKKLNRFEIVDSEGQQVYWLIPMKGGRETKQGFVWEMREELESALRTRILSELIDKWQTQKECDCSEEKHKWALLNEVDGKGNIEIIRSLRGRNIVDDERVNSVFKYLLENKEDELNACVNHLFDESVPLNDRIAAFKKGMKELCPPEWKNFANDERTAAALLSCRYPDKYTIFKDELYQIVCGYFGFATKAAGQKLSHYYEIINFLCRTSGDELQSRVMPQLEEFHLTPENLTMQTLLWSMRGEMQKELRSQKKTHWLVGYTIGDDGSQSDRFIKEGIWEGIFHEENKSDKALCKLARQVAPGDIIILKSTSTKGPKHNQPFMRVKGIGVVAGEMSVRAYGDATICRCAVQYINCQEKDFDGSKYGRFRKTIHKLEGTPEDLITYINEIMDQTVMPENKYKEYIELLEENRNLVLTGAPGTGKTFMAHEIAREMDAEVEFVQFHPSYDYTDFVEGLRPVENGDAIGFKRKDGIFKDFCRRAAKNLLDAAKSVETLRVEKWREDEFDNFISDAIEQEAKLKTISGKEFIIDSQTADHLIIYNENNEKTPRIMVKSKEILELLTKDVKLDSVPDVRQYFNRTYQTQADSYTFSITNEIRKKHGKSKGTVKVTNVQRKPFVFIIDEINRGEASKIFGELFYAIDPGYRGKSDRRVQTQYQNLVEETDIFGQGFYVPENVYILATMNDIDRSVESMDFAMRRRFTWREVTPDDTAYMLDELPCADKAKAVMNRLNNAIENTDGLGASYMVGPSYFLKLGKNGGDFVRLWRLNIEPLLKEYLRGFRRSDEILAEFREAYFGSGEVDALAADSE